MKYLYKFDSSSVKSISVGSHDDIDLKVFTPSLRKLAIKGENVGGGKTLLVRLLFQILTFGKTKIYYVQDGNQILHTSYVIPACSKFPFLKKNDLEIGPCYTYPEFRGKGIYPKVLTKICQKRGGDSISFYMIVDENNLSSIKGIEKAGFVRCGSVYISKFARRYRLVR